MFETPAIKVVSVYTVELVAPIRVGLPYLNAWSDLGIGLGYCNGCEGSFPNEEHTVKDGKIVQIGWIQYFLEIFRCKGGMPDLFKANLS
jgi:hypothetical protein